MAKQKVTKKAISSFIKSSPSRYNEYPKAWVVNTIYGVLLGTEPRKELYGDRELTYGSYTESRRGLPSGRTYYFDYAGRKLSDSLGNVIEFI